MHMIPICVGAVITWAVSYPGYCRSGWIYGQTCNHRWRADELFVGFVMASVVSYVAWQGMCVVYEFAKSRCRAPLRTSPLRSAAPIDPTAPTPPPLPPASNASSAPKPPPPPTAASNASSAPKPQPQPNAASNASSAAPAPAQDFGQELANAIKKPNLKPPAAKMGAPSDKHEATPGSTPDPKDLVGYQLAAIRGAANGEAGAGDFSDEEASHEAGRDKPKDGQDMPEAGPVVP